MGDIGGGLQAGASVADTMMTDATNVMLQKSAQSFNAQQAAAQRQWAGGEQLQQESFNNAQRIAAQNYNTQMSDTAIQRRAADIKSAGFNPLLAVGQLGGASSPSSPGASAGIPGGAAASSPAPARIDSLGVQNLANLKLTNAQAANVQQDTAKKVQDTRISESQADQWAVDTSQELLMARSQSLMAQYGITLDQANIVANTLNLVKSQVTGQDLSNTYQRIQNQLGSMDVTGKQATLQSLISMQNAVNAQQTQEAKNVTAAQSGLLGKTIAYAQAILTPVSSAAGAAASAGSAARSFAGASRFAIP